MRIVARLKVKTPNKSLQTDNLRGVCIVVSLSLHFTTMQTPHKLRLSEALAPKREGSRMFKVFLQIFCLIFLFACSVQENRASDAIDLEESVRQAFALYMEKNCTLERTHAKWEGFPLKYCTYSVTDQNGDIKSASVFLLNPDSSKAAGWIKTACSTKEKKILCYKKVIKQINISSGFQFPVAGVVYEDLIPKDGVFEAYCFRDGVTTIVDGFEHRNTNVLNSREVENCISGVAYSALTFARIHGGTREEYTKSGGKVNVGSSSERRLVWLDVVRKSYQDAWNSNSYELLNAWVNEN